MQTLNSPAFRCKHPSVAKYACTGTGTLLGKRQWQEDQYCHSWKCCRVCRDIGLQSHLSGQDVSWLALLQLADWESRPTKKCFFLQIFTLMKAFLSPIWTLKKKTIPGVGGKTSLKDRLPLRTHQSWEVITADTQTHRHTDIQTDTHTHTHTHTHTRTRTRLKRCGPQYATTPVKIVMSSPCWKYISQLQWLIFLQLCFLIHCLCSHNVAGPITKTAQEVSGFINNSFPGGQAWRVVSHSLMRRGFEDIFWCEDKHAQLGVSTDMIANMMLWLVVSM